MLTYGELVDWANESVRNLKFSNYDQRTPWSEFQKESAYRRRMVFVGNGISRLANPKSQSWRQWISPLLKRRRKSGLPTGNYLLSHLQLAEVFDYLKSDLGVDDYREIWSSLWDNTERCDPSSIHRTLISFFDLIVTTNYDTLLERSGIELIKDGKIDKLQVVYFVSSNLNSGWKCVTYERKFGKVTWNGNTIPSKDWNYKFPNIKDISKSRIILKLHGTFTLPDPDSVYDDLPRKNDWLDHEGWESTVTSSSTYQASLRSAANWDKVIPALKEYDMVALGYGFNPEEITIHHLVMEYEAGQRYRFALLHGSQFDTEFRYRKYGFSVSYFDGGHGCDTEMRMSVVYVWLRQLFYDKSDKINSKWKITNSLIDLFENDYRQVMEKAGYDIDDHHSGPRARCVLLGQVSENIVLGIESAPQMEHSYRVLGNDKRVLIEHRSKNIRDGAEEGIYGQRAVIQMGGQMLVPATFMARWLCRKQKDNPELCKERIILASIIGWDERGDRIYSFLSHENYLDNSLVLRDQRYPTEWAAVATYQGLRTLLDVQTLQPSSEVLDSLRRKIDSIVFPKNKLSPRSIYFSKWFLEDKRFIKNLNKWNKRWSNNDRPWIFYETGGTGSESLRAEIILDEAIVVDFVLASIPAIMRIGTLPIIYDGEIVNYDNGKSEIESDQYKKKMFENLRKDFLNRKELMVNFFEILSSIEPQIIFKRLFDDSFSHMPHSRVFVVTLNEIGALVILRDPVVNNVLVFHIETPDLGDDEEVRCALGAGDAFRGAFIDSILDATTQGPEQSKDIRQMSINACRRGVGVGTEKVRYFSVEDAFNKINEQAAERNTPKPTKEFSKNDAKKIYERLQLEFDRDRISNQPMSNTDSDKITLKPKS